MLHPSTAKGTRGWLIFLCLSFLLILQSQELAVPQPSHPTSSTLEDTLLFREGEALFSNGETEKALWRFKKLVTEFPKSSLSNEAKFRMAVCYTRLRRPKDAIRVLEELLSTFLAPPRMVHVFHMLGDNHMELKDPKKALHWYGKGILIPGQPNEELKKKVRFIIDSFDNDETLSEVESLYRGAYAGGYAKLKLIQLAKRRGNEALAQKLGQCGRLFI